MSEFLQKYKEIKKEYVSANPFESLSSNKSVLTRNPLVLYGAGLFCENLFAACRDLDIKVTAICDSFKKGAFCDTGLEIITPGKLCSDFANACIIVCSYSYREEISKLLMSVGFSEDKIFNPPIQMIDLIHPVIFERDYLAGYEWAYGVFTDDVSKKLILDRIRRYLVGTVLTKTSDDIQYFHSDIIKLHSDEVFVDGGSYDGNTAVDFIKQTNGVYCHIYSFEPDDISYKKAIANLKGFKNTDVIAKGLWSGEAILEFSGDGGSGSSFVMGVKKLSLPVTSIDTFFAGKDELPTFIKMDIEGSEKEALCGARNVIVRNHPKIAISAYHKPTDIYELPKLICEIDPKYKLYLRQCEDGIYETVLYAV